MSKLGLLLITATVLLFTACKKDDESFTGNWSASDSTEVGNQTTTRTYTFTVQEGSNSNELRFNGFAEITNGGIPVTLNGNDFSFQDIELQDQDGNDIVFFGSGSFSGNTMTYSYTFNTISVNQTWTGSATR